MQLTCYLFSCVFYLVCSLHFVLLFVESSGVDIHEASFPSEWNASHDNDWKMILFILYFICLKGLVELFQNTMYRQDIHMYRFNVKVR